jgi:hypothetical protein
MFVEMLATLEFFPTEAGARIRVGDELRAICGSLEEVYWLVTRVTRLYRKWPGLQELRLVFCAKYQPLDGLPALGISEAYPEGFPSERPPAPEPKRLTGKPAPGEISAAASVEDTVRDLAEAKDLNRTGPPPRVRDIPIRQLKPEERITPEMIRAAEEKFKAEKAARDLQQAREDIGLDDDVAFLAALDDAAREEDEAEAEHETNERNSAVGKEPEDAEGSRSAEGV